MLIVVFVEFTFLTDYTPRRNFHQSSSSSCLFKSSSDNNIILYTVHNFYALKQGNWVFFVFLLFWDKFFLNEKVYERDS